MDGGVVEFHALPDADRAGAEHQYLLAAAPYRFIVCLVGRIEVGDVGVPLACAGVYHLVHWTYPKGFAEAYHIRLAHPSELAEVLVSEAHTLRIEQQVGVQFGRRRDGTFQAHDVVDFLQEQEVYLRAVIDARKVDAEAQELGDCVNAVVGGTADVVQQLLCAPVVEFLLVDVAAAVLQRAHSLEDALLKSAAYAHHFAGSLHLGAELVGGFRELVEGETGHLRHHVVDCRLAAGGGSGYHNLVQGEAHGYFRGHAGDGEAAGLRGERRRTGHPRIYFDEVVLERERVECELHVAAAFDAQRPDELQGGVAQQLVFLVGQRLCGRYDHRVAGVHAYGVHVLHTAHCNRSVGRVAHHLELYLLVALDALFHEHLVHGRKGEGVAHQVAQLLGIVGEAAAGAAQGECRAQDYRIADFLGDTDSVFYAVADFGRNHGLAYADAELLEFFAVLGLFDAFEGGAEDFDSALVEHALAGKLHGEVEAGLAAETRDYGVRTLVTYDLGYVFKFERLHIHLVGDMGVGHNGGRIGIDEDDLVALFLERKAGLCAGIIEFCRLSDDDRTGAYHHYFMYISPSGHFSAPPSF